APHAISYDVCILSIAVAFLVADGLARGFLPGERGVMLACWPAVILPIGPIPAIVSVILLVLVVRRALRCRADVPATTPGLPPPPATPPEYSIIRRLRRPSWHCSVRTIAASSPIFIIRRHLCSCCFRSAICRI